MEARAALLAEEGAAAAAHRHVAESRMPLLRQALEDLISEEAGREHIAKAASHAWSVLAPRSRALTERLQGERLPIDELAGLLADQRERLEKLNSAIPRIREESGHRQPSVLMLERLLDAAGFLLETHLTNIVRPSELLERRHREVVEVITGYPIVRAWVFGSVARGDDRPNSDLDLLVELAPGASVVDGVGLEVI